MKKLIAGIALVFSGVLIACLCGIIQDKYQGKNNESFYYSDGEIELVAVCANNSIAYDSATIFSITKGDAVKNYVWKGDAIGTICIDKMDLTEDGTEDYTIKYRIATGTGVADYFLTVLNGQNLAIEAEFGSNTLEKFTSNQMEIINNLMEAAKEKEPEILANWESKDDCYFPIFEPTATEYNGRNGILVRVVEWYDHSKGIEIEVFLKFNVLTRTFDVEELVSYKEIK